jgi:hypothetical protein
MSTGLRRREFIAALGGAAAWPLAARAQQGDRVRRIGVLWPVTEAAVAFIQRSLRDELQKLKCHAAAPDRSAMNERRRIIRLSRRRRRAG